MASSRIAAIARRSYMDPDDEEEVLSHHGEDIHGKLNTLTFQQVKVTNTSRLRYPPIGSPPPPQPPPKFKADIIPDSLLLQRTDPLPTAAEAASQATTEKVVTFCSFMPTCKNTKVLEPPTQCGLPKTSLNDFDRTLENSKAISYQYRKM